jgi:hypothetical protein
VPSSDWGNGSDRRSAHRRRNAAGAFHLRLNEHQSSALLLCDHISGRLVAPSTRIEASAFSDRPNLFCDVVTAARLGSEFFLRARLPALSRSMEIGKQTVRLLPDKRPIVMSSAGFPSASRDPMIADVQLVVRFLPWASPAPRQCSCATPPRGRDSVSSSIRTLHLVLGEAPTSIERD